MNTERIYRGHILSIRQLGVTTDGIRQYEVWFRTGKAYYQISNKKTLPISIGDLCRFTGAFYGPNFIIQDIISDEQFEQLQQEEFFHAQQAHMCES